MELTATFNPTTARSEAFEKPAEGPKAGTIVHSTPWLMLETDKTRKEYLKALERDEGSWDVIKHTMFFTRGTWEEEGVEVVATDLDADALLEFIRSYEAEKEAQARESDTTQAMKPDLEDLIYKHLPGYEKKEDEPKAQEEKKQPVAEEKLERLPTLKKRPETSLPLTAKQLAYN